MVSKIFFTCRRSIAYLQHVYVCVFRKLEEKVELLISEQGRFDSKRWYYIQGGEQHVAVSRDAQQAQEANEGFR
jgi:hypothetical protein